MSASVPLGELIQSARSPRAGSNTFPLLSMTMHEGLVDQAKKFKKRVASEDTSQYKVVSQGQLVVGFPIDEGVLDIQDLYLQAIVSPAYGVWDVNRQVEPRYLTKFLRSPSALAYYRAKLRGSTARRRSLPADDFLNLAVPLPPIEEQRRIVAILDHADGLRSRAQQAVAIASVTIEQIFARMFGSSEGDKRPLSELADVTSGITKGRKLPPGTSTSPSPYLAVSNVQDRYLDLDVVKTMDVSEGERERFKVRPGDLLMTEGGDPDKLGRGTVWNGELPEVLHQNHVFRVRIKSGSPVLPVYLSWFTASREARSYFLRSAKQTTGIASINKTQLSGLPVLVPSHSTQCAFVQAVKAVEQATGALIQRKDQLDDLMHALQARAFSGRL